MMMSDYYSYIKYLYLNKSLKQFYIETVNIDRPTILEILKSR